MAHTAHIGGLIAGMLVGAASAKIAFKKKDAKVISTTGLRELAHSDEAKEILDRIEGETNPEIREAWIQEFADTVACPRCNGVLEIRGNKISCPRCGWERRIE